MIGKSERDTFSEAVIRQTAGMCVIIERTEKSRLKQFYHVMRMGNESVTTKLSKQCTEKWTNGKCPIKTNEKWIDKIKEDTEKRIEDLQSLLQENY